MNGYVYQRLYHVYVNLSAHLFLHYYLKQQMMDELQQFFFCSLKDVS